MNLEELRDNVQYHVDGIDDIGIRVYVLLKADSELRPRKLDIHADALPELKNMFISSMENTLINNDELSLLNLSSSDERLDAIYLYDLDIPQDLSVLQSVLDSDEHETFNVSDHDISSVKAFLIEIGDHENQVILYKTLAPVNVFGRSSFFLKKSSERFEKIEDEFLRLNGTFQLMQVNDKLFVIDLKTIERFFGFHDVIVREATNGVNTIESLNLLDNPEVLHELIEDVKYARRLTKVSRSSPVLERGISNDRIVSFCRTYPGLAGRIRLNDTQDKLQLDTNVSKDLFIKLLMDDFLTSELTEYHYASVAKDNVNELIQ